MKIGCILIFILLLTRFGFAQLLYWESIGGNDIIDVAVNSNGYLFISESENYPEGNMYRSTDKGKTWELIIDVLGHAYINCIAIDSNDIIFLGLNNPGGIYISTDNGDKWLATGILKQKISAIKVNKYNNIFAGSDSGLIFKSIDSGINWKLIKVCNSKINEIIFDKNDNIYIASEEEGILKSTDGGDSWRSLNNGNISKQIYSLQIDKDEILYTIAKGLVFKSFDYGGSWQQITVIDSNRYFTHLSMDKNENLYISSDHYYELSMLRSTDKGGTWKEIGPWYCDIKTLAFYKDIIYAGGNKHLFKYDKNIIPYIGKNYFPLNKENVYQYYYSHIQDNYSCTSFRLTESRVIADTLIKGLNYYKTSEIQNDWIRYSDEDKKIYIWYNDSDYVYMDFNLHHGSLFTQLFPETHEMINVRVKAGYINLFGKKYHYKSHFNATEFIGDYYNVETIYTEELGIVSKNISTGGPYGGTSSSYDLIQSKLITDEGEKKYKEEYQPQIQVEPISIYSDSILTLNFSVVHSYTHFNYCHGITSEGVNFIDSVVMYSYYEKAETSCDSSISIAVNIPVTQNYIINKPLNLSLLKEGYKFKYKFIAKDKGIIPTFTYAPYKDYFILTYDTSNISVNVTSEKELSYRLEQNFPNPFNPVTTIKYSIAEKTYVQLKLFDVLGKEVAALVNEEQDAGIHNYRLSIANSKLPSGVYFYHLKAGNYYETKKLLIMK